MRPTNRDPQRWSALSQSESLEARLGDGLRQVREDTDVVPSARLARIRAGVREKGEHRHALMPLRLAFLTLAVTLLFSAGVASAVVVVRKIMAPGTAAAPASTSAPLPTDAVRKRRPARQRVSHPDEVLPRDLAPSPPQATAPADLPTAPADVPTALNRSASPARTKTRSTRSVRAPGEAPPPAATVADLPALPTPSNLGAPSTGAEQPGSPTPFDLPTPATRSPIEPVVTFSPSALDLPIDSPHAEEAALMVGVVRALRRLREPKLALERLDEHATRFPRGMFEREAKLARIEAHLALGQHAQALHMLEPLAVAELPRPRPVWLLRGSLRAAGGRCGEAVADFTSALQGQSDAVAERALRGRAICRARMGDRKGAAADVRQHLEAFPSHPQGVLLRQKLRAP